MLFDAKIGYIKSFDIISEKVMASQQLERLKLVTIEGISTWEVCLGSVQGSFSAHIKKRSHFYHTYITSYSN